MNIARISLNLAALVLLSGCHTHLFGRNEGECHRKQEYQRAQEVAPLRVPEGLDAPNVQGALAIPAIDPAAPTQKGPSDPCLDEPPRYKPPAPGKPANGQI